MRHLTTATGLLVSGVLALAAPAGAEDVGSPPLRIYGPNPASYCNGPLQGLCATVQTTRDGSGTFVLTIFAPAKVPVTHFDLQSGTMATRSRPRSICRAQGTDSAPEYQLGAFYVTRCSETIKPGHHQTYCFAGLGRIPSTQGPGTTYGIAVDGGAAGGEPVKSIPSTSKCPASVATRKRQKR